MTMRLGSRAIVAALTLVAVLASAGCKSDGTSESNPDGDGPLIALLLPDAQTARYEAFDRPEFEKRIAELCPSCSVLYANANQDAGQQQAQAESALARGVAVLVLDPVDSVAAATIVAGANRRDVPVIAYDRFIEDADLAYFISFDNEQVGKLQGEALVRKMKADGNPGGDILMVNGSPTDHNASLFKAGAHRAIDASGLHVLAEFDTPGWVPSEAQQWTAGQIVRFGTDIDGVYAANDSTAGGAIAALKAAGVSPLPPVTGQDADLTAIQRIVAGDQYMTVYKAIRVEARTAADAAWALINGERVKSARIIDGIPTDLLKPVPVTLDTIMTTVVQDGFYTVAEICTSDYKDACAAAGIG